MELTLLRKYHENGTNGQLYNGDQLICFTIELPWLQNRRNVSCIPEGRYQVVKRTTKERGDHLHVVDVPDRSWILFHAANHALIDLKGCIAPVSKLDGPGLGFESREALGKLDSLLFNVMDQSEEVFITIKKEINMNIIDRVKAPTPKFFKVLRNVGLALAAAGGAILASPIALPAGIVTVGGYLLAGGSVLSAVSQSTVEGSETD
ncbi:DUF5675 family protein [Marinoscillum sp.]|uniref:DUF5675 family protein n=1 Tax=Marinoscillum sp. TaxID=2024838 RepID=UPI003BAB8869